MKKGNVSYLFILISGILWGCIGLFVRPLNTRGLASMDVVFVRSAVTALAMLVFLFLYDRKLLCIKIRDIWCFIGTGILSIVFFNFCYFQTIKIASMSVASILLYTAPAMVMIMSYFLFGEPLTKQKNLALIFTFLGCAFVSGIFQSGDGITFRGIIMGLGAGLGYALYSIFSRFALEKGYHTFTITFYTFLIASMGSVIFMDTGHFLEVISLDRGVCILGLLLGLLCTVTPYLLYTLGLKCVSNGNASIIASIEPVTATLLGFMVYHEKPTLSGIVGILLVLGGIAVSGRES